MWSKFKLRFECWAFGRCPGCGGCGKEVEPRGLKYFLPPLHCDKCNLNYSASF